MRNSVCRILAATVSAGALTLAGAGIAAADTPQARGGNADAAAVVSQDQSNRTTQSNSNFAPVTQVNPAVNVGGLFTRGGQSIDQNNAVTSRNDQSNSNTTRQRQTGDATAAATGGHATTSGRTNNGSARGGNAGAFALLEQSQSNTTRQSNSNFAPVTQVNPAVNVGGIGTRGGQSIYQDNAVRSSNDQSNSNTTRQRQSGDAAAIATGGHATGTGSKDGHRSSKNSSTSARSSRGGDATATSVVEQSQSNTTRQSNSNFAPVTQVNPAVNVGGIGTRGGQSIYQDNAVRSSNDQSNSNTTRQRQSGDAAAIATGGHATSTSSKDGCGESTASRSRGGDATATSQLSQSQANSTRQSNANVAPVTQVNPAVNVGGLFTRGGQSISQDNTVTSRNDQSSTNSTRQHQSGDAVSWALGG